MNSNWTLRFLGQAAKGIRPIKSDLKTNTRAGLVVLLLMVFALGFVIGISV